MSKKYLKQQRQFSPTLKQSIVGLFDRGQLSALQISREYCVSESTVYRWIYKYSQHNTKGTIIVMDKKKQHNELQSLKQRIAELERAVGHKQMQIDYYEMYVKTMDELAPEELKKVEITGLYRLNTNRQKYRWTMKRMLQWQGITRQGMHQAWRRLVDRESKLATTVVLAAQIRQQHPGMGCRDMYYLCPELFPAGRDWTERVLLAFGYARNKKRSFTRAGAYHLKDLIAGKTVTGPNQVWQTDITYVWAGKRWHYVSFLVDVFDCRVVDFTCTRSLRMGPQIQLVTAAMGRLSAAERKNLIVHTDRGVQYGPQFTQALKTRGAAHSMAHYAWQNAYCERFHRTIKNGYLKFYKLDSDQALEQGVKRAVKLYNTQKPHSSLPSRMAPLAFNKAFKANKYPGHTETVWADQQNMYLETTTKNVNVC